MKIPFLVRHTVRRVRDIFGTFANPWSILFAIVTRRRDVVFQVDQLRITTLNSPGAWGPVLEVFVEDEYALDWFLADLPDDLVALDVGAHVGCFALELVRRFPHATVHSYEPTPSTGTYTQRNVSSNGFDDQVTVHTMAVAATRGTFTMADNGPGRAHNGVLYLGQSGSSTIEVECRSLADAVAEAGDRIDLVKLDAEGAEYDILLGTDPALLSTVRRFVLEFHPSAQHTYDEIRHHVESAGLTEVRRVDLGPDLGLAWFTRDPLD